MYGTCHGSTSLGERGQIVIPKKVRAKLGLKKGDHLIVIEKHGILVLAPSRVVEDMISDFSDFTQELRNSEINQ